MNIIDILKSPEGKTLEFKRDASSHIGIMRTLIAFANTAGGTLVIGVEDKTHHIIGIADPLSLEEKITNLINDLITPQILPDIGFSHYKQTQALVIHIYPSSMRPHFLKKEGLENGTYIRIGSTNRKADIPLIHELQRYAMNQAYDEQPFSDLDDQAIDFEAVSKFFAAFRKLKRSDLETLRLVVEYQGKSVPTVGGMLLFGKKREKYFPDAWIQAGRFFGIDKSKILDTIEIHSYPVLAIEEAIQFVQKHTMVSFEINALQRTEHRSIPLQAVREAIINAVTHADYSQRGAPIRISIFHDRLEIENPGLLPFSLTIDEILQGISKLRNRVIGRVFNELKLVEQWGSGIQRIIAACKEAGLPNPTFEEIGTHFRVTIFTQAKEKLLLNDKERAILTVLKNSDGSSTNEIAQKVNLSPRTIRYYLSKLIKRELIVQIGNNPNDPTKRIFLKE